jgi:plastocyanin
MPKLSKAMRSKAKADDVLEVVHHEIPENAAGAGAAPIPTAGYRDGAMTWRRMLRAVAITEVAGMAILLTFATLYGVEFFAPLAVAALLFVGAVAWLPRMSKASAVYALTICSLTLVMFGGLFFGWTGFTYPQSWFEMSFATLTTIVPIAGIVAGIATLRHHDAADAARNPARATAALAGLIVLGGLVGTATASNATRLPGDVTLTASSIEFEQKTLTAKAGDVTIYFKNKDPFAHNVRIDGHGTSKNVNGRQSVRHVFRNLAAGTYAYYCAIHTDMKGTLTVT